MGPQQSRSHLKPGSNVSHNIEGGQYTSDIRTSASEKAVRQIVERVGLDKHLAEIKEIEGGLKLVWDAHSQPEVHEIDLRVNRAAEQIAQCERSK